MKKGVLCVFMLFTWLGVFAQDGLYALHKKRRTAQTDCEKVNALMELSDFHYRQLYNADSPFAVDSALFYVKKARDLSIKIKDKKLTGQAYSKYSEIMNGRYSLTHDLKDNKSAEEQLNKAIGIFKSINDQQDLAYTYYQLLHIRANTQSLEKTIAMAKETLPLVKKGGDKKLEGTVNEDISYYLIQSGNFDMGIAYAGRAIELYKTADKPSLQRMYSLLGGVYNEMGEFEKALDYCLKAVKLAEVYKSEDYGTVDLYNYTGVTYRSIRKYDEALRYFKKAVQVAEKLNFGDALSFYESNAAEAALLLDDKKQTLYYLHRIEQRGITMDDPQSANSLVVLSKSYVALRDTVKADKYSRMILSNYTKFDNAPDAVWVKTVFSNALMTYYFFRKDFNQCRNYTLAYKTEVEHTHSRQKIMNAYHMLFMIDSAQANYKSAVSNLRFEQLYKDSIFNEAKNKQLTEMQVKYETQERIKDNALLKKQSELQQSKIEKGAILNIIGLTIVVLLIVVIATIYRRYLINQRIRREINRKNRALEELVQEKEWLLKEIHHRVKNNLQIVMSLLNTQSHFLHDDAAKEAILNSQYRIHSMSLIHKKLYLSENIVSVSMPVYITELVEYFKSSFSTGHRISFSLNIDPIELNSSQCVPVALILNETIMNSVKHAFPEGRKGTISISFINLGEDRVRLSIDDDGIGLPEQHKTGGAFESSLGMKLIKGFSRELNADLEFRTGHGLAIVVTFLLAGIGKNHSYRSA